MPAGASAGRVRENRTQIDPLREFLAVRFLADLLEYPTRIAELARRVRSLPGRAEYGCQQVVALSQKRTQPELLARRQRDLSSRLAAA